MGRVDEPITVKMSFDLSDRRALPARKALPTSAIDRASIPLKSCGNGDAGFGVEALGSDSIALLGIVILLDAKACCLVTACNKT